MLWLGSSLQEFDREIVKRLPGPWTTESAKTYQFSQQKKEKSINLTTGET